MMITRAQSEARLEDARFMAETGECLDGAARRLGLKVNTLEKFLWNNDRACLSTLMAHRPRDHNRLAAGLSISDITGLGERRRKRRQRQEVAA